MFHSSALEVLSPINLGEKGAKYERITYIDACQSDYSVIERHSRCRHKQIRFGAPQVRSHLDSHNGEQLFEIFTSIASVVGYSYKLATRT